MANVEEAPQFSVSFDIVNVIFKKFSRKWISVKMQEQLSTKFCFSVQTFAGSLGRGLNMWPAASCSNAFLVIHRMFEH